MLKPLTAYLQHLQEYYSKMEHARRNCRVHAKYPAQSSDIHITVQDLPILHLLIVSYFSPNYFQTKATKGCL